MGVEIGVITLVFLYNYRMELYLKVIGRLVIVDFVIKYVEFLKFDSGVDYD